MDPIFNRQQKAKNQEVTLRNPKREISTSGQGQRAFQFSTLSHRKRLERKEDGSLSWEIKLEIMSKVGMTMSLVGTKIPATEMLKRTLWRIMTVASAWIR